MEKQHQYRARTKKYTTDERVDHGVFSDLDDARERIKAYVATECDKHGRATYHYRIEHADNAEFCKERGVVRVLAPLEEDDTHDATLDPQSFQLKG